MEYITIVTNARTRELISLVLRWYRFVNNQEFNKFNISLVKIFACPNTLKHIPLSTDQALYLRAALNQYEQSLNRKLYILQISMKDNPFVVTFSSFIPLQFTLKSVKDLLFQLSNTQID